MFYYSTLCLETNANKLTLYDENNNIIDIDKRNIDLDKLDDIIEEICENIDRSKFSVTLDFEMPFTICIYPKDYEPVEFDCKYGKCVISDEFFGYYNSHT